jgi:multidrug transporter EmrE-like cation transporter
LALGLNYSIYEGINIFGIDLAPITYFASSFLFSLVIGIIGMVIIHKIMKKTENSITRKKSGKLSYNYI